MNYLNVFIKKALASLMLAGLCLCFGNSISRASCPTDVSPVVGDPGYVAWTPNASDFLLPGTTDCYILAHYCYRTVNGVDQFYIEDFGPDHSNWGSDCGSLTWQNILAAVREYLFQHIFADNCGYGVLTVATIVSSQCAKWVNNSYGYPVCEFCSSGAYCEKTCDLCNNGSGNTESNCTYTTLNTASCDAIDDWTTLTVNAVKVNSWSHDYNHCYLIGCDQN
ncbi:MAG TPA: hypothetical protein VNX68_18460 [Nitrosopumilaceae archaeon]|jgi:hypothetical protein|nr:hypothetical protein [Nitrosopumilaceae archaeon]